MILYSNEIVFRGHPDKVCDQISDAILDAYLAQDPDSRCGIETVGGKGKLFITGEVTSKAKVNVKRIARRVLQEVGYDPRLKIINNIGQQSPDIALGTNDTVQGAGDQGMMFGFATNETRQKLPKAQVILQTFSAIYDIWQSEDPRLKPDGKAQITGYYTKENGELRLQGIKTAVINYQNTEKHRDQTDPDIRDLFLEVCRLNGIDQVDEILINPTGKFEVGGFEGDSGLTGRKIIVDTYQSFAAAGGGAFSGKDPTKVDRSGAYKAREIAKQILEAGKHQWVEVQLSYAIGIKQPLAIYINTDQGPQDPDPKLYKECEPHQIIKDLDLKNIEYEPLARYGHFKD